MAKKKSSSIKAKIKSAYDKHKEQIVAYLMEFLETGGKTVLESLKQVTKVKDKIKKIVVSTGLVLAALVVVLIGIANYLSALTPNWPPGLMQVVVGAVAIVLALIYVKT
ncbi:hypothetical protein KY331_05675 [Candidatus Woesearchaeota archaeon]|nr:hypothetical protein [Candidatus Woesearchaeota archaeon]